MIKEYKKKIAIFLAMAAAVVSVGGCGGAGNDNNGTASTDNSGTEGASSSAMGRYVEEVTDLSDKISGRGNGLYQLSNGNLLISDKSGEFLKTGDNGAVWMTDTRSWWSEMLEDGVYVMSMAVGPDNTAAFEEYITPKDLVDDSGVCGSYILSNNEGLYVHLEVYWPDETLLTEFRKCMEELDTAYLKNDLIEYAVYEEGIAYIQGTKSLDEAVEGIGKKISLYMAE